MTVAKVEMKKMPLDSLDAYRVAKEVLKKVLAAQIGDAGLRDQAVRAAQSTCLNIAEAVGRGSGADRKRVFRIARGVRGRGGAGDCSDLGVLLERGGGGGGCSWPEGSMPS